MFYDHSELAEKTQTCVWLTHMHELGQSGQGWLFHVLQISQERERVSEQRCVCAEARPAPL